jgi:alpha-tubulin suppressor-like RCC1 family protein
MPQRPVALSIVLLTLTAGLFAFLWSRPEAAATGVRAVAISAGSQHTCALIEGGGAKCWGDNSQGQLGAGKSIDGSARPVDVANLDEGAVAVDAGPNRSCFLTIAGGVKCSGANGSGQLGHDRTDLCFFWPCSMVPEYVRTLESGVEQVGSGAGGTGSGHSCALTTSGGVKCWGVNFGVLGDGGACGQVCTTPIDVPGLESGVSAIAVGYVTNCAVMLTRGVKCWGNGFLGDGGVCSIPCPPVDVVGLETGVATVSVGALHSCALMMDGGVKCWGLNGAGQLGDGTTVARTAPVDVVGLQTGVAMVTAAEAGYTCTLTTAGAVKCWGGNSYGQLGLGFYGGQHLVPEDVPGLQEGVIAIDAGLLHTCAVVSNGGVKCWGSNDHGALGDGLACLDDPEVEHGDCPRPVDVLGLGPKPTPSPTATAPEATGTPTQALASPTSPADTSRASPTRPSVSALPLSGSMPAGKSSTAWWLVVVLATTGFSLAAYAALRHAREVRPQ